jgi:hypothetical protein
LSTEPLESVRFAGAGSQAHKIRWGTYLIKLLRSSSRSTFALYRRKIIKYHKLKRAVAEEGGRGSRVAGKYRVLSIPSVRCDKTRIDKEL